MKTHIKLIAATIVLTVMIWVYADLSTHEVQQIPVVIEPVVPAHSDLRIQATGVETVSGRVPRLELMLKMSGSKAALREIEIERQRSKGQSVRIPIQVKETVGPDTLGAEEIREYITEWARQHSLQLADPIRQSIEYMVDRWIDIDAAIEADVGPFAEQLRGPVNVEPNQVKVGILESQIVNSPLAKGRLVVSIVDDLRKRSEDDLNLDILLRDYWRGAETVKFQPERVRINVRRKEGSTRQRLTAIPLHELWPSNRAKGLFKIVWSDDQDLVQHIDVVVPASRPRALTSNDVTAYVVVEPEDLVAESSPTSTSPAAPAEGRDHIPRDVHFVFAPGFQDVKILPPLPKVRFKVVRADESSPIR